MTGPDRIEFFYDLSSPWTYLAFANLSGIVVRCQCGVTLRPVLVGGVFNAVNPGVYTARDNQDAPKYRHSFKVMHDWAAWSDVTIKFPSQFHPAKSIHAMRFACALAGDQSALWAFSTAAFESYIGRGENLDDPDVLVAVANAAGLDGEALRLASQTGPVKDLLRANTDELIARGGYGSPTIFVDRDDMYFGNDQLPLVEFALKGKSR